LSEIHQTLEAQMVLTHKHLWSIPMSAKLLTQKQR